MKLNNIKVKNATKPGKHIDGHGLFLLVKPHGARSWVLRMQYQGKRRDFGLGSEYDMTLSEAREKAKETRRMVKAGQNPVQVKIDTKQALEALQNAVTFEQTAHKAHAFYTANLKSAKHKAQWLTTLRQYVFPSIGTMPIADVQTADIVELLKPIWHSKPETAKRVMGRACRVVLFASETPDREAGTIDPKLVASKLGAQNKTVKHHVAMDYAKMPAFLARVKTRETIGRLALRFLILTASRSGEVRFATWGEFDLVKALWTIPGERMKAGKEHLVPLCKEVLAILQHSVLAIGNKAPDALVFPGSDLVKPMSDQTLTQILRKLKIEKITIHGFRSSFRDWAAEKTNYQGEVVEAALAHTVKNKVEAAYRRTNYLAKRIDLMQDYADFLDTEAT